MSVDTRYRVAFASDTDPMFARPDGRMRRDRPGPMTCSTPAMALRFAAMFGKPVRLYVEAADEATRTFDLRDAGAAAALEVAPDWPTLVDFIRTSRSHKRAT